MQHGGLYCDGQGLVNKPFPNKPYCYDDVGNVAAVNLHDGGVTSFCQTILPGDEAMYILTAVKDRFILAVPNVSYWTD